MKKIENNFAVTGFVGKYSINSPFHSKNVMLLL